MRKLPFETAPQAEVGDELQFHLEQRIRDYIAQGMDPATARATALERFGDVGGVQRECTELLADDRRAERRRDWIGDLKQDLRFGVRSATNAKLFTLIAVITLALGIGANAAVFGVVKSVLLDALPYREPGRLVRVSGEFRDGSASLGGISTGAARDLADRQRSFSSVAIFQGATAQRVFKGNGGAARMVTLAWVQPGFFTTLGVAPAIGRNFRDDDALSDTSWSAMLTHGAWQEMFGGDPAIVGKTFQVNGITRTVAGVLPASFVSPMGQVDVFLAMSLPSLMRNPITVRGSHNMGFVARLNPGATIETAKADITAISNDLSREYPKDDGPFVMRAKPLRDSMVGDTRTPLLVLMASAGLVLLITCANLAGALLSRTISRRKEFAVRVALGAGRERLVRQLLTESVLLSLAGGVAGVLLALLGLTVIRSLALNALPAYAHLAIDPGTLVFTMMLALCTGIAFGVVPALSVGRTNTQCVLRDETRGSSESRRSRQLRGALVAGQIALCLSLLTGAGLLTRSLYAMMTTPVGFNPDGVLTVDVQPPAAAMNDIEPMARYYSQLEDRIRAIPGITAVASVSELPSARMDDNGLSIEGEPPPPNNQQPFVTYASVSDEYFRLMGIPLRSGRAFGPEDLPNAPTSVVISASMAKKFWPKGDALGARIRLGPNAQSPWKVIVGVVGDVRNDPLSAEPQSITYLSRRQEPTGNLSFLVRTQGDPIAYTKRIQAAATTFDPDLATHNITTLSAYLSNGLAGRRLPVVLMTGFGALALLLASVGVYAMFAAMATAREREFGVRVALGSTRQGIAALVLRQGALWMAVGLAVGVVGVLFVGTTLRNLLFGVRPFDPLTLVVTALMIVACASSALLAPVRRATQVDPISEMR